MVHMRSPQGVGSTKCEMMGNFSEPSTCDRLQESFSLNLWKKAFEEALQRLCPVVQAERCGCLHVLTRMVHSLFTSLITQWNGACFCPTEIN